MPPISLNIGPSEVSAAVRADLVELAGSGLLSASHRGDVVKREVLSARALFCSALRVPPDYELCFQPSATAAMELILRNCVRARSFHLVQGAFADRFARTAEEIGLDAVRAAGDFALPPAWREAVAPRGTELVAVTHNETSTGEAWPWEELRALRERDAEPLIAVDVTSSVGGMTMDWSLADLWFGSVQKCLGLPAGLGFVLAGPRARERALALGEARHVAGWQDMSALVQKLGTGQTPETPNVLGIALLGRQMARWDLERIESETRAKADVIRHALSDDAFYVRDPGWRSLTTHCLRVADPAAWKARAAAAGFEIGSGYGPLASTCIRIATFPSVTVGQIEDVMRALTSG